MKERPIILCTEMVRATLEGRKTKTRRVVKDPRRHSGYNPRSSLSTHGAVYSMGDRSRELELSKDIKPEFPCPYGQVGDRLWVRETFCYHTTQGIVYKADYPESPLLWKPSIHMYKCDSRITLEITEIRVERLQEITEEDANKEGNPYPDRGGKGSLPPLWWFKKLWDSLNAKRGYSWESNPWVWVISFKRI